MSSDERNLVKVEGNANLVKVDSDGSEKLVKIETNEISVGTQFGSTPVDFSDDNPQPVGTATPGTDHKLSRAGHVHAHGNQSAGTSMHALSSNSANGFVKMLGGVANTFLRDRGDGQMDWQVPAHGDQAGGTLHALATNSARGFIPPLSGTANKVLTDVGDGTMTWSFPGVKLVSLADGASVTTFSAYNSYVEILVRALGAATIVYDVTKINTLNEGDIALEAGDIVRFAQFDSGIWQQVST